jgi:hypothetical protein
MTKEEAAANRWNKAVAAIKEALAQPAQEPSQASYPEYDRGFSEGWDRCKAAAQRPWVGLTDEEIETTLLQLYCDLNQIKLAPNDRPQKETVGFLFARAIETSLRSKNT